VRCFIAAWPGREARLGCAALTQTLRGHADHGRVMRADNVHLTLAFMGTLDEAMARCIAADCRAVPFEPFDWQLDTIGHFIRARVLWAGGPLTPELQRLAAQSRALLDARAVAYDRKDFVPHVTLLRDVKRYSGPARIEPPLPFAIESIGVYQSGRDEAGARYLRVEP
jgi:2'-5' RNA ligase